jgi:predicted ABC-type ATPase
VPEDEVRGRYSRPWLPVADAISRADTATVYDNTRRAGPREVAVLSQGFVVGNPSWPDWTPDLLTNCWPSGA